MGQNYVDTYLHFPDCAIVAVVDPNLERAQAIIEHHGELRQQAKAYADTASMLVAAQPDIVSIVTPGSYFKAAVLATAAAGSVKAVQCEKPFGGPLQDADEMVEACERTGTIFHGGALCVALPQLQQVAMWLDEGRYGTVVGASIHGWSAEILGAGNQHTTVLRRLCNAEVDRVVAWCDPPGGLRDENGRSVDAVDGVERETGAREPVGRDGAHYNGIFSLSTGVVCPVFGHPKNDYQTTVVGAGVRVVTDQGFQIYSPGPECQLPPEVSKLSNSNDGSGCSEWVPCTWAEAPFTTQPYEELGHLGGSIRSMVEAVAASAGSTGSDGAAERAERQLAVSGRDLRAAQEVSTAGTRALIA